MRRRALLRAHPSAWGGTPRDVERRPDGRRFQVAAQARDFARRALPPTCVCVVGGTRADVARVLPTVPWPAVRVVAVPDDAAAWAAARPAEDLVLLRAGARPQRGWLGALALAGHRASGTVVGPLLVRDGRITSGGVGRGRAGALHRFAGMPEGTPPAQPLQAALGLDGACLHLRAGARDALPAGAPAPELCAAAWRAGGRVLLAPAARCTAEPGPPVAPPEGERRVEEVVYVTQDTGIGGGHRVVFQHLNGLAERGHRCELWTLDPAGPDWFDLHVPVRRFADYPSLARELAGRDALKVGTWWETIPWVWEASVLRGVGAAFVQDLETSYYPEDLAAHGEVLAAYRPELRYVTTSAWVTEALSQWVEHVDAVVPPGLDPWRLEPPGRPVARRDDVVLALGRSNPLKDFPLTRAGFLALPEPRPELWLFGIEPQLGEGLGRYVERPSDDEVDELLRTATALLQTSVHEGFCLPVLEAMAAGAAVVCTDAHGNRDFCRDGENCLMPGRSPEAVAAALRRVLEDRALRERLVAAGRATAEAYAWPRLLDRLDAFVRQAAG